jgi:RNA polymerase-binding transcription factor DksA
MDPPTDASDEQPTAGGGLDLDAIERRLADVEAALDRLEVGTYWTCEVTGQPLPDELLAADPTARRLPAT